MLSIFILLNLVIPFKAFAAEAFSTPITEGHWTLEVKENKGSGKDKNRVIGDFVFTKGGSADTFRATVNGSAFPVRLMDNRLTIKPGGKEDEKTQGFEVELRREGENEFSGVATVEKQSRPVRLVRQTLKSSEQCKNVCRNDLVASLKIWKSLLGDLEPLPFERCTNICEGSEAAFMLGAYAPGKERDVATGTILLSQDPKSPGIRSVYLSALPVTAERAQKLTAATESHWRKKLSIPEGIKFPRNAALALGYNSGTRNAIIYILTPDTAKCSSLRKDPWMVVLEDWIKQKLESNSLGQIYFSYCGATLLDTYGMIGKPEASVTILYLAGSLEVVLY
ncbi:hypothetical protein [uncultured Bdellovibrio sp.]|uniref:hypothetical protein n=1 Tax=Bdellovibrio sp. HCB-162 TaxID=3394234 RepID=UPI0025DF3F23|nr:hypothetical protein [uncultured Bdellovibrio sp.]